jgi:hypothetical protein
MSSVDSARLRRHGLYYPFFHVRSDTQLKLAALYWPRIVRVVPEGYRTRDSDLALSLIDEFDFIKRLPPGESAQAASATFLEMINAHGERLSEKFSSTTLLVELQDALWETNSEQWFGSLASEFMSELWFASLGRADGESDPVGVSPGIGPRRVAVLHRKQTTPDLAESLLNSGMAAVVPPTPDTAHFEFAGQEYFPIADSEANWLVMDSRLVAVYSALLAENIASANNLMLTTDQDDAYAASGEWTVDVLANELVGTEDDPPRWSSPIPQPDNATYLGFLALELVVPDNLESIPATSIIEIRRRYADEFVAFGQLVDRTASAFGNDLSGIRDRAQLESYAKDVVAQTFTQPMADLNAQLRGLGLDAKTLAVNVKTELPAGVALAGGTWLTGHPVVAGVAGIGLGLLGIRNNLMKQRGAAMKEHRDLSYLLHVERRLSSQKLLNRTLSVLARATIGG